MRRRGKTRGENAIYWIERYCLYPGGAHEGERVKLRPEQSVTLRRVYDGPGLSTPVTGDLAGYIALLHLCGPEAPERHAVPAPLDTNPWTLWRAAGPELKAVLHREDGAVRCPALGTRFPPVAA